MVNAIPAFSGLSLDHASGVREKRKRKKAVGSVEEPAPYFTPAEDVDDVFRDFRSRDHWKNDKDPVRKQAAVILAAVSEVITSKDLKQTPTAYFGSLMSCLEKPQSVSDESIAAATSLLLSIALPRVPPAVLRSKASQALAVLVSILDHLPDSLACVKSVIPCFATLLQQQLEPSFWAQPVPLKALHKVLELTVDARPKIRRKACDALASILDSPSAKHAPQLASALTKFCNHVFAQCSRKNHLSTLHFLRTLEHALAFFPAQALETTCAQLVALLGQQIPLVTTHTFLAFSNLFTAPTAASLSPETIVSIVAAIREANINKSEPAAVTSYVTLVAAAAIKLHTIDAESSSQHIPATFAELVPLMLTDSEPLMLALGDAFQRLVRECVDDLLIEQHKAGAGRSKAGTALERVLASLESLLKFKYKAAWDIALKVYAVLFQHVGRRVEGLLLKLLRSIADLYDTASFHFRDQLKAAIGAAIAALGPAAVLSTLPLDMERQDGSIKFEGSRAWLLPLLRDHITRAELKIFASYVFPFAKRVQARSVAAAQDGRAVEAKNLMIVYHQLWALWPKFCDLPNDTVQGFPTVAKNVGMTLQQEPDLAQEICSGLYTLISKNRVVVNPTSTDGDGETAARAAPASPTPEEAQQALDTVARFAPNFLPVLFNLFGTLPEEKRSIVQQTVTEYVAIVPAKVATTHFKTVVKKLLEASTSETDADEAKEKQQRSRKQMLTELALAFVPALDADTSNLLFRAVSPFLQDSDGTLQKKAYKVVRRLCKHNFEAVRTSVPEALEQSLETCSAAAKKTRLRCIQACVEGMSELDKVKELLAAVMGEVLLATKEINGDSRLAAFNLIVQGARNMIALATNGGAGSSGEASGSVEGSGEGTGEASKGKKGKKKRGAAAGVGVGGMEVEGDVAGASVAEIALREYLSMVAAGLAASHPHIVSATLMALSRLLFEFHKEAGDTIAEEMIETVRVLLDHGSKEILTSVLGFFKVAIVSLPKTISVNILPFLVPKLMNWPKETKNHFRQKIRVLVERLIRKFGFDEVEKLTPEEDKKLLANIRKLKQRRNRKHAELTNKDREQRAGAKVESEKGVKQHKRAVTERSAKFDKTFSGDQSSDEEEDDDLFAQAKAGGRRVSRGGIQLHDSASGDPTDLLSDPHSHPHPASLPNHALKPGARLGRKMDPVARHGFKLGDDGKIVVPEDDEPAGGRKKRRTEGGASAADDYQDDDEDEVITASSGKRKRKSDEWRDDDDEEGEGGKRRGENKGKFGGETKRMKGHWGQAAGPNKQGQGKRRGEDGPGQRGEKKKQGKGDVKKGKLLPYEYLPLDPAILNKRLKKSSAATSRMRSMVKAAKNASTKARPKNRHRNRA